MSTMHVTCFLYQMIVIKHGRLFFKNSSFFKKLQCGILSGPETGRSFRATFWFVFTKPRPTASGLMLPSQYEYVHVHRLAEPDNNGSKNVSFSCLRKREGEQTFAYWCSVSLTHPLSGRPLEVDPHLSITTGANHFECCCVNSCILVLPSTLHSSQTK